MKSKTDLQKALATILDWAERQHAMAHESGDTKRWEPVVQVAREALGNPTKVQLEKLLNKE